MLRSIITTAIALVLLFTGAYFEHFYIEKTFTDFSEYIEETELKLSSGDFSDEDSTALEEYWLSVKHSLHAMIPHNEIKEVDLWVSECTAYTRQQNFNEALSKLAVLKNLAKEIPKTFTLSIENIF